VQGEGSLIGGSGAAVGQQEEKRERSFPGQLAGQRACSFGQQYLKWSAGRV